MKVFVVTANIARNRIDGENQVRDFDNHQHEEQ